jgi:hypothetical protein
VALRRLMWRRDLCARVHDRDRDHEHGHKGPSTPRYRGQSAQWMNAQRACVRHSITQQPIEDTVSHASQQERCRAGVDAWATWPVNTERGLHMSHGVHEDWALERAHVMQDELGTTAPAPHRYAQYKFVERTQCFQHITSCDMQSAHYLRLFSRPTHIIVSAHICGCVPQTHTHTLSRSFHSPAFRPPVKNWRQKKTTHKKTP